MKYRVEIEETTTKVYIVEAVDAEDAEGKAKEIKDALVTIRSGLHSEVWRLDDDGLPEGRNTTRYGY